MAFFDSIASEIKKMNPYADVVEEFGDMKPDQFLDTGSYTLNALISTSLFGGMPPRVIGLAGDEATGKTYFTIGIIKSFLDANPGGGVLYFESEGGVEGTNGREMLKSRGVDTRRVMTIPVATVEDFRNQSIRALDRYLALSEKDRKAQPMMFVLDSLGMLSTMKELADAAKNENVRDMTRTQLIKSAFRVLTLKLGLAKVPMIVTAHTFAVIGSSVPTKDINGGGGIKYAASIILMLSKRKEKDGTEVIGNVIHVANRKNRLARENAKTDVMLDYRTGLSRYYGLLDLAVEGGVFKKIGNKVEVPVGRFDLKLKKLDECLAELGWSAKDVRRSNEFTCVLGIGLPDEMPYIRHFIVEEKKGKETEKTIGYSDATTFVPVKTMFATQVEKVESDIFTMPVLEVLDEIAKKKFSYGLTLDGVTNSLESEEEDVEATPEEE